MQRVRPDIAPEPVESNFQRGRPRSNDLEYAGCHPQPDVGGDHLDTSYPLGNLATFLRRQLGSVSGMLVV